MTTYLIESPGPFGNSSLRVVDDKWIARRGWQMIKTKQARTFLIDDKGRVEAAIVDEVLSPEDVKITYDIERTYL